MILDLTNLSIDQIKTLNSIWEQSLQDYNKITEQITRGINTNLNILLHPVVSRNPYQSDIYIDIIYTYFAIEEYKSRKNLSTIIAQNNTQKKILKHHFSRLGDNTINLQSAGDKKTYGSKYKASLIILFKIILYITTKNKKRIPNKLTNNKITLIDTFILQNSLEQDKYIDRYYPGLLNHVSSESAESIYWIPSILGKFSKRKLNKIKNNSTENILYKHDLLSLIDYLKILLELTKKPKVAKQEFYFRDMNISLFVHSVLKRNVISTSSFEGIINYYFIKKLRKLNVQINMVIDWNENQPIDKGLIKGIHDFYPWVKVKGYQGYIISSNHNFYIQPTQCEIDNGVIPDEICVVGKYLEKSIKKFTNEIKVSKTPAFRFGNVYKDYQQMNKRNTKNILVALPIGLKESVDIIRLISKTIIKYDNYVYKIKIKLHPALKLYKLRELIREDWQDCFEIVNGDFNEILTYSTILIGSTSSTLVESLARGIPVIVVGSQRGITQNPIPDEIKEDIWTLCYTPEEIAKAIDFYVGRKPEKIEEHKKLGREIRSKYFEPVTDEGVRMFLNSEF